MNQAKPPSLLPPTDKEAIPTPLISAGATLTRISQNSGYSTLDPSLSTPSHHLPLPSFLSPCLTPFSPCVPTEAAAGSILQSVKDVATSLNTPGPTRSLELGLEIIYNRLESKHRLPLPETQNWGRRLPISLGKQPSVKVQSLWTTGTCSRLREHLEPSPSTSWRRNTDDISQALNTVSGIYLPWLRIVKGYFARWQIKKKS